MLRRRRVGRYGWRRDLPDIRDHLYSAPLDIINDLPPSADLRAKCPEIYDQGHIGSCTANAIASAIQFDRMKFGKSPDFIPSRLLIYYNERAIEGSVLYDAGGNLRDGIKSVCKLGVAPESLWTYDGESAPTRDGAPFPPGARAAEQPAPRIYQAALQYKLGAYQRLVPQMAQLKGCLAAGYPFLFGITAYHSFEAAETMESGIVPMPSGGEPIIAGHAVLAVGYDDAKCHFIFRNSWGAEFGEGGYGFLPYAYVLDPNLSADFWTIRNMSH